MNEVSVTLDLDEATLSKMRSFYADSLEEGSNDSILFSATSEEVRITVYKKSRNGLHKALFQGNKASYEASIWGVPAAKYEPKKPAARIEKATGDQIGSDEVGVGDFFGPVIVAAAYVSKTQLARLKELGVTDSKMMTDERIRELGPLLLEEFDSARFAISIEKYNDVTSKGHNLNAIKAVMHNKVLLHLHHRHPEAKVYQDQFALPKTYFSYLKEEPEVLTDIVFATKGETKFPCVALASVIARYTFLEKMDELNDKYGLDFPFGAGSNVDEFASRFLKKYGIEELRKIAKVHFANYKRLVA